MQASSEDGLVACYDARKGAKSAPLYRLSAHDRPACALTFCTAVPGLLATASTDKQVQFYIIYYIYSAVLVPSTFDCKMSNALFWCCRAGYLEFTRVCEAPEQLMLAIYILY